MKVVTYNVQGFNNPNKLKALWKWIHENDVDIICLQEHKKHDCINKILHYGGILSFMVGLVNILVP